MYEPNAAVVQGMQPAPVWRAFAELASVPRPSKREEQIRAHMRVIAQRYNFPLREDATGNQVLDVPATPGHEHAPTIVLQGHLDMVCEKNSGTTHDFDRDPIKLVSDRHPKTSKPIVRADGTTLGADNGIGLALALAAATERDVVHGPLELLCTIDEEMGMTGAKALAADFLKGRKMINLDSEEDDALYIGCAGGGDTTLVWDFKPAPPPKKAETCRVTVAGLRGGHSGCDIHLNRGNAIKLLVRTLRESGAKVQLAEIRGGSKRNVIPREASAIVVGPAKTFAKITALAEQVQAEAIKAGEDTCKITVEKLDDSAAPTLVSTKDTLRLLTAITALPHGVLATVPEIPGLVQTSNSTSTIETAAVDGLVKITVGCLSRSSALPEIVKTAAQIRAVGELAAAQAETGNMYPGWQPNVDSALLATCRRLYEQQFGAAPRVAAIHAGLECGIIGERIGEGLMDMISFGPHIEGAHSPDERVYVESVEKIWNYLKAVLAELARG